MAPELRNYHGLDTADSSDTRRSSRLSQLTASLAAGASAACATQSRGGEEAPEPTGSDTVYVPVQPDTVQAPEPDTVQAPEPDTVQVPEPDTVTPEEDFDQDGIPNSKDPCMYTADFKDQSGKPINIDGDTMPDACDGCKTVSDDGTDSDNDGVPDACDNSPGYNPSQADSDFDGIGDKTDNAPNCFNPEQVDSDGDDSPAACGDCNDNDADFNPDALDELCDQVDKDCDGNAEDSDTGCACTVGATQSVPGTCADGEKTCQLTGSESSGWVTTTEPDNGTAEICGNNVDEDCSTVADDAPECVNQCEPSAVQDCGETQGECGKQLGTSTCDGNGAWGACVGDKKPTAESCNGLDDDCDDATDEDFGVGESCTAKGSCGKVEGHKECMGAQATICDTAPGGSFDASVSETCNGEDEDCDGEVDNAVFSVVGGEEGATAKVGTACKGVGECGSGTYKCEDTLAVKCSAFDKAAPTDACDAAGKDENCDGVSNPGCECDDGDAPKTCQTQANVCVTGTQECVDGNWSDCNGEVPGVAETCDGVDNNCDGKVDNLPNGTAGAGCEGKMGVCADVSGQFECDGTGGVVCTSEYSATQEVCGNKLDDDCDGLKDEGPFTVKGGKPGEMANPNEACSTGVGECKGPGVFVCASDFAVECDNGKTPGVELPDAEQKDEDCDGASNEGFACKNGDPDKSCQSQPVVCEPGEQTCVNGNLSDCAGEKLGTAEVCDGKDNDCSGTADDEFNIGGDCKGKGECGNGVLQCATNDSNGTMCSTMPGGKDDQSSKEVCNGADDDCDGVIDDLTDGTVGKACPGTGACSDGVLECKNGDLQCSTMPGGTDYVKVDEVCNGQDDDCDGKTDEGGEGDWAGEGPIGLPCSELGECGEGYTVCATGQSTKCSSAAKATSEVWDGKDNNCNGAIDEGSKCEFGTPPQVCGEGQNVCQTGIQECIDGTWSDCQGVVKGIAESCNGADDDCSGTADDDFDIGGDCTGKGECGEGVLQCNPSDPTGTMCSTMPGGKDDQSGQEVCDGKDNDCDGVVDDLIDGTVGKACPGKGVCPTGVLECDKGVLECSTMEGGSQYIGKAEVCDGVDNNCDGVTDEGKWAGKGEVGFPCSESGECGEGYTVCATPQSTECSALDNASPEIFDGKDNDCDTGVDEGFDCQQGDEKTCGTDEGECTAAKQTCVGGKLTDCNDVGSSPEKCDGLDNDCDGVVDNGFDVGAGCNGKGVCNIEGEKECNANGTGTQCDVAPGGSKDQSGDEVCNSADDDCDGQVNEGIGDLGLTGDTCVLPGECGKGEVVCDGKSDTKCETELKPGEKSEKCDGKDNDCDEAVDEGFKLGETCTDKCGDVGVYVCKTGNTDESECSAKDPKEVPGNGVDDDCDGVIDEIEGALNIQMMNREQHQAFVLTKADVNEIPHGQLMRAEIGGSEGAGILSAILVIRGLLAARKLSERKEEMSKIS